MNSGPFVLVLLRTAGFCLGFMEKMSFEMGSPPLSQIILSWDKNLFPFSPVSASRVYPWWQQGAESYLGSRKALSLGKIPKTEHQCQPKKEI